MSFCVQTPWLMNATIRDNIAGLRSEDSVDDAWYARALYTCCLEEDIAQFPERDQLVVGSGGIRLSGGQRQRIVSLYH